jgi:hypothetical protein
VVLLVLLGMLGMYVGIWGFWLPKVDIQAARNSAIQDPYLQGFTVQNTGHVSLKDLFYECSVKGAYIDGREYPPTIIEDDTQWLRWSPFDRNFPSTLTPSATGQAICASFEEQLPSLLSENHEITVAVSYRPTFFPFRREKRLGFYLKRAINGSYSWIPVGPRPAPEDNPPIK